LTVLLFAKLTMTIFKIRLHSLLAGALLGSFAAISGAHEDKSKAGHTTATAIKEQKAWGIGGDAKAATRTVTMTMDDNMRFSPSKLSFKQGDTVRFVIQNKGKLLHEMVIGTRADLDAHAAMMVKFPTMAHDEPYMAHVNAGQSGALVWTFNRPGDFEFACLIAGHYQAGMVGTISVSAR
jgi:uncharacterized cupredoxin-like copper-binding protein